MKNQKVTIVGSYILEQIIGQGSFASVYKGKNTKTQQAVAIKKIDKAKQEIQSKPFTDRETNILKSLKNDNIVKLYDQFETEKNVYLILEYCGGGDLKKYTEKNKYIPEQLAQKWMQQLANGMKELFDKNIIHRDLKLANILLTEDSPDGEIKITDMGFARKISEQSLAKSQLGTPLNMAPEI